MVNIGGIHFLKWSLIFIWQIGSNSIRILGFLSPRLGILGRTEFVVSLFSHSYGSATMTYVEYLSSFWTSFKGQSHYVTSHLFSFCLGVSGEQSRLSDQEIPKFFHEFTESSIAEKDDITLEQAWEISLCEVSSVDILLFGIFIPIIWTLFKVIAMVYLSVDSLE